ncbi:MAG: OapC/ArvC family zinc-ribbon domain-containing protein [Methanotrichaceae archaeon]
MPHMCTRCKSVFEEGVDILKGCPVCGGKKFLFVRSVVKIEKVSNALKASEIEGRYEPWPENENSLHQILKVSQPEDQNDPRQDILDSEAEEHTYDDGKIVESIKVPEPGTYELNLTSLFERDELVMAMKDGTYLIDISSAFKKCKKN